MQRLGDKPENVRFIIIRKKIFVNKIFEYR